MSAGKIITFYSYKGGVGRTMALANVGVLLAQWGFKVLCVDWDLEAPGLHLYFRHLRDLDLAPGLVELVHAFEAGEKASWRGYPSTVPIRGAPHPLEILTAGAQDDSYERRMQAIQWNTLYEEAAFGRFLESVRDEWKQTYDFTLVDSRTGITDIGGICTIQLPDDLVLLLTANEQSLRGSLKVARQASAGRAHLAFERALLRALPVPTRFEGRFEYDTAQEWLGKFAKELAPLYADFRHQDVQPSDLLKLVRIPYVPKWSFDENLPVLDELDEGVSDPESISYAFETLAALLAQGLGSTDVLVRNRDSYVEVARSARRAQAVEPGPAAPKATGRAARLFLSYSHKDEALADELMTHLSLLHRQGIIDAWHDRRLPAGADWKGVIDAHLATADIVLLLVSPDFLASDYVFDVEMKRALERHEAGQARVIPVLLRPTDWYGAPFAKLQGLPKDGKPVTTWTDQDEAWNDVAKGIRGAVEQLMKAPRRQPTSASLRRILKDVLRSTSELDAFCMDYFPDVARRFSDGMDRTAKTNLLLQMADRSMVLNDLQSFHPDALAKHEYLLRYE